MKDIWKWTWPFLLFLLSLAVKMLCPTELGLLPWFILKSILFANAFATSVRMSTVKKTFEYYYKNSFHFMDPWESLRLPKCKQTPLCKLGPNNPAWQGGVQAASREVSSGHWEVVSTPGRGNASTPTAQVSHWTTLPPGSSVWGWGQQAKAPKQWLYFKLIRQFQTHCITPENVTAFKCHSSTEVHFKTSNDFTGIGHSHAM